MALTKATYAMIADGYANVKDYGAKGDGVTNDIVAFNLALRSGKKSIYIPSGIYIIEPDSSAPQYGDFMLYIGSHGAVPELQTDLNGMTIFGDGWSSVIKLGDDVGSGKLLFGAGGSDVLASMTFRDFAIDLNGENNLQVNFSDPLRYNSAFYLYAPCYNMMFDHLYIYNGSGSQWIRCGNDTNTYGANITVKNCRFNNFGIGLPNNNLQDVSVLYIQADGILIDGCWWQNGNFNFDLSRGQTAAELHGDQSTVVTNCRFSYTQLPVLIVSSMKSNQNVHVDNNTMIECAYLCSLDSAYYDQKRITISNNIFQSTKASGSGLIGVGNSTEPAKTREEVFIIGNTINCFGNTNKFVNVCYCESAWLRSITISDNNVGGMLGSLIYFAGVVQNDTYCDITIKNNRLDSLGNVGGSTFPTAPTYVLVSPSSGTINSLVIDGNVLLNTATKDYSALGCYRVGGNINYLYIDGTESSVSSAYPEVTTSSLTTLFQRVDAFGPTTFTATAAANVKNQTLFLDSGTSKLSYVDGSGVVHTLY